MYYKITEEFNNGRKYDLFNFEGILLLTRKYRGKGIIYYYLKLTFVNNCEIMVSNITRLFPYLENSQSPEY